jgi:hypothetical protein
MASSVEDAFSSGGASCIEQIKATGGYDAVVGFDYNFLSDIGATSGPSFANFLNTVAACGATLDVEAHSEGGPVVMSGIIQASSQAQSSLRNLIGLGPPWQGTPMASVGVDTLGAVNFVTALLSASLHSNLAAIIGSVPILGTTISDWEAGAFIPQLAPNSTYLGTIQGTTLHDKVPNLTMITACGNAPIGGTRFRQWLSIINGNTSDGFIGLTSCQAGGSSANVFTYTNVQYLPPYAANHINLACDSKLYTDVGTLVRMINACSPADQTAHNNACFAQYSIQSVCSTGTLIQQSECVNAAIHTYETCLSYCTPP